MQEIVPETTAEYLRHTGRVPPGREVQVHALGWGVSNLVMKVEVEGHAPFVLKQSRERLRTQMLWLSRLDRIWSEREALEVLDTVLPPGTVPKVLWADEDNYLFAMTCAPEDSVVWKEQLLAGKTDAAVGQRAGEILGAMHSIPAGSAALAGRLADTSLFDQLRVDPYYRTVAERHPERRPQLQDLIDSMAQTADRTFVHADFSPKNILVHGQGLTVVDFETAHAGDPAFDLGFFLSHLLLKAFRAAPAQQPYLNLTEAFWRAYLARTGLTAQSDRVRRGCRHAAACALARVDGKSPVDYLDEPLQAAVRRFAAEALRGEPGSFGWDRLILLAAQEMRQNLPEQGGRGSPS